MRLFTVGDAQKLWQSIVDDQDCSPWSPEFVYCGSFDYRLQAFSVLSMTKGHYIWIPVEWKPAARFLNHVIYCFWHASLDQWLPDFVRETKLRTAKYGERLRSGFFSEVLEYWYPPGTQLPINEQPTRQDQPLHSCYLTSFLVSMLNMGTPVPMSDGAEWPLEWRSDITTLDWEKWAMKKPTNRILYGALPNIGTKKHKLLLGENNTARIPNAPSVEIDSSSWSRFASEVHATCSNWNSSLATVCAVSTRRPRDKIENESSTSSERRAKRRRTLF